MQDDPQETVRRLANLEGIPLPEDRIAALAAVLDRIRAGIAALREIDYGEAEPAAAFRPRRRQGQ